MSVTYFTGTTLGLALSNCWGFATGVVLGNPLAGVIDFYADGNLIESVVTDGVSEIELTASDPEAPPPGVTIFTATFTPEDSGQSDFAESNPVPFTVVAPVPFEDDFNRDDTPTSAGPAYVAIGALTLPKLVSNAVRPIALNAYSDAIYLGEVGASQFVEVDVKLDAAEVGAIVAIVRADILTDTYYYGGFIINDSGHASTAFIKAWSGGAPGVTDEVSTSVPTPATGDIISLTAFGAQLVLRLNGTVILVVNNPVDAFAGIYSGFGVYALSHIDDAEANRFYVRVAEESDSSTETPVAPGYGTILLRRRRMRW